MDDTSVVSRKALAAGKHPKWRDIVIEQISAAGFECEACEQAEDALKRMAFIPYELVVVDEHVIKENNHILSYLVTIPMELRRKALYLITGPKFKTMDNLAAFSMGIDGLLNHKDLNKLASCIHMLKKEHDQLYREFLKCVD